MKHIGDQVAQGLLTYESYMLILLSACSTYDKNSNLLGKQKHEVYQTNFYNYACTDYPHDDIYDSGYEAYHIATDILDILVNNTNTNSSGINKLDKAQETLSPSDEWDKLTQEKKERILNYNKSKPFQAKCQ
jgi:hypothetical protein